MKATENPAKVYTIPVEWIAFGTLHIEATSLAEACARAAQMPFPAAADDGEDMQVRFSLMHDNAQGYQAHTQTAPTEPYEYSPGFPLSADDEAWLAEQWTAF